MYKIPYDQFIHLTKAHRHRLAPREIMKLLLRTTYELYRGCIWSKPRQTRVAGENQAKILNLKNPQWYLVVYVDLKDPVYMAKRN